MNIKEKIALSKQIDILTLHQEGIFYKCYNEDADVIGMSGLLVKSTVAMKENLEVLNERGLTPPVILGGAALTREYVEVTLRELYDGEVYYAKDAFEGMKVLSDIIKKKKK
jgi:5-methyltetrahydrofolate--homocysteine methyltransferase